MKPFHITVLIIIVWIGTYAFKANQFSEAPLQKTFSSDGKEIVYRRLYHYRNNIFDRASYYFHCPLNYGANRFRDDQVELVLWPF